MDDDDDGVSHLTKSSIWSIYVSDWQFMLVFDYTMVSVQVTHLDPLIYFTFIFITQI